jgi:hypothetical protein
MFFFTPSSIDIFAKVSFCFFFEKFLLKNIYISLNSTHKKKQAYVLPNVIVSFSNFIILSFYEDIFIYTNHRFPQVYIKF